MEQKTVPAAAKKPKKERRSEFSGMSKALVRRETISAYLFLLPYLVFFLGFVVVPMIICVVYSFLDYGLAGYQGFVGFANYIEMFQDPVFIKAFWNTVLIVVVAVPAVTAFSLWVGSAICPMKAVPRSFFRCVFYLPVVTGTVAVTVVWKWMFNTYNGLINQVFGTTNNWLGDPKTAIWCIIMILFTTSIGQPIVLYVAALGNVDQSLIEAAQVDGATKLQVFWTGRSSGPRSCPPRCISWSLRHQQLPVLRADPAVDFRRPEPRHRHHHVLYLRHGVQVSALRLCQRHGRCPGADHRGILRDPVQGHEDR